MKSFRSDRSGPATILLSATRIKTMRRLTALLAEDETTYLVALTRAVERRHRIRRALHFPASAPADFPQ